MPAADDFLAQVCAVWEREAVAAEELGMRVVRVRTGIVLDKHGGALEKMLPFFKLCVGGPVAGGNQWMPWIHLDDLVGIYLRALDDAAWIGARQRHRARAGAQQGLLARARPRAAPAGVRAGPRLRRARALRRDGRHRGATASARCPRAPRRSATRSAIRSSTRRCGARWRARRRRPYLRGAQVQELRDARPVRGVVLDRRRGRLAQAFDHQARPPRAPARTPRAGRCGRRSAS